MLGGNLRWTSISSRGGRGGGVEILLVASYYRNRRLRLGADFTFTFMIPDKWLSLLLTHSHSLLRQNVLTLDLRQLNIIHSPAKGAPLAKASALSIPPKPKAAALCLGPTMLSRITFCVVMNAPSANPSTTTYSATRL